MQMTTIIGLELQSMADKLHADRDYLGPSLLDMAIVTSALRMAAEVLMDNPEAIREHGCRMLDALETDNLANGQLAYIPMQRRNGVHLPPDAEILA
jgi:hypothetical protein